MPCEEQQLHLKSLTSIAVSLCRIGLPVYDGERYSCRLVESLDANREAVETSHSWRFLGYALGVGRHSIVLDLGHSEPINNSC